MLLRQSSKKGIIAIILLCLIIATILYSLFSNRKKQSIDLIMFMGQSNMAGRGEISEKWSDSFPTITNGAGYEYRAISDPYKLHGIEEPFGLHENNPNGIDDGDNKTGSLVTSFINAYYKYNGNVPVIAVSASKGGCTISDWYPGGPLQNDAVSRLKQAKQFIDEQGYTIRHTFILWCQGESDGDNNTGKNYYFDNFRCFLDSMKIEGVENLFLISIGHCNKPDYYDQYEDVIEWQDEISDIYDDVIMVSKDFITMRERGLMKDSFHYYQTGYNECGTTAGINVAKFVNGESIDTLYYNPIE